MGCRVLNEPKGTAVDETNVAEAYTEPEPDPSDNVEEPDPEAVGDVDDDDPVVLQEVAVPEDVEATPPEDWAADITDEEWDSRMDGVVVTAEPGDG
jgi:hypothetical protein